MVRLAPSILSADFADLAGAVASVRPYSDLLHVDVMDGHFVPNLTIGPVVVEALRRRTDLYLDCHLMITDPHLYLEAFRDAGADGCSVHVEVGDTGMLLGMQRELGLDVGLAVNPDTPFEAYAGFLGEVDLVLLMTVFPGFGGQSFIADVLPKIRQTRAELDRLGSTAALEVDGGIDRVTAPRALEAGADTFVAGSAVFSAPSPAEAAVALREAIGAGEAALSGGRGDDR